LVRKRAFANATFICNQFWPPRRQERQEINSNAFLLGALGVLAVQFPGLDSNSPDRCRRASST
ncbi:MAG: hypothetical protein ACYT04_96475, partial [Nostoc sp.]